MTSRVAAALIGVALLCAGPARAQASPAVPRGFVGMTVDGPLWPVTDPRIDLAHELDRMVAGGVENLRVPVYWSALQPYARFGQIPTSDARPFASVAGVPTTWSSLDALVVLAAARRVTLLPVIIDAPTWDAVPASGATLRTPRRNAPFARVLTALVKRYGPHGSFWAGHPALPRIPIRAWQIWNEPYLSANWALWPWPPTYGKLLHAAHDAIKRADPGATVVLAGLADYSWEYLGGIYLVPGARRWFDVVALHPYTAAPAGVITLLGLARAAMVQGRDAGKPIAITELGWPSSCRRMLGPPTTQHCQDWLTANPFGWEADQAGQRTRLARVLRLLAVNRTRYHVVGFDYYDWAGVEYPGAPSFNFAGLSSLTSSGLVAKPAYRAFVRGALALEHRG